MSAREARVVGRGGRTRAAGSALTSAGGWPKVGVALVVLTTALAGMPSAQAATPQLASRSTASASTGPDAAEAEALRLTNRARSHARKCGRKRMRAAAPLSWSETLAMSAHEHSADMASNDFFSHNGSDGRSPFARMRAVGYDFRAAGENIAAGLPDPAVVVRAWLRSPGHCRAIMNRGFKELGLARVEGPGRYGVYWTQDFGSLR